MAILRLSIFLILKSIIGIFFKIDYVGDFSSNRPTTNGDPSVPVDFGADPPILTPLLAV